MRGRCSLPLPRPCPLKSLRESEKQYIIHFLQFVGKEKVQVTWLVNGRGWDQNLGARTLTPVHLWLLSIIPQPMAGRSQLYPQQLWKPQNIEDNR